MADSISQLAKSIDKLATAHSEGLNEIAKSLKSIAHHISWLGNGDAVPKMGGLEGLGKSIEDGLNSLTASVNDIASQMEQNRPDPAHDE